MNQNAEQRCTAWTNTGGHCRRRGYDTYSFRGVRCWQHDPLRDIDEGEESYKEHQQ